jgi:hypothetical protein
MLSPLALLRALYAPRCLLRGGPSRRAGRSGPDGLFLVGGAGDEAAMHRVRERIVDVLFCALLLVGAARRGPGGATRRSARATGRHLYGYLPGLPDRLGSLTQGSSTSSLHGSQTSLEHSVGGKECEIKR